MEFTPYQTYTEVLKEQNITPIRLQQIQQAIHQTVTCPENISGMRQYLIEADWVEDRKPFYNVWPGIIPMLLKISLDFPSDHIKLPMRALNLRLPKGGHPALPEIRTILFGPSANITGTGKDGVSIWVNRGEIFPYKFFGTYKIPMYTWQNFFFEEGVTVAESIASLTDTGEQTPEEYATILDCVKLVIGVCMIGAGQDRDLICPDILSKDRGKWDEALRRGDENALNTIEARALRRKGPGWDIGRIYERDKDQPWIVPPHPQRYHTGPGGRTVVLKMRKGWIKNREGLTNIPSGHDAEN